MGPAATVPVAVAIASGSIIISPLSLVLLELGLKKDGPTKSPAARMRAAIWRALTKPVVLAPLLGILFSLSGLETGRVIDACLHLIGEATPGVALFLTGLIISSQSFRLDWRVVGGTALADIMRPLLMAAVVLVLPVSEHTFKYAILLAAVPAGFFGTLFAVRYRLDAATPGSMLIASIVFSIVTMSIIIAALFPH